MKYFDFKARAWLQTPGRDYLVSLPYNLACPTLSGHTLIAHKRPAGTGWEVSHQATSFAVGRGGKTRAAAIDNAFCAILRAGEEAFISAVAAAEKEINSAIGGQRNDQEPN